jgi:hypothetical protein
MADKQTLKCPTCGEEIVFDPLSKDRSILSGDTSTGSIKKEMDKEVVIYLKCPNGHVNAYKVKKDYL